MGIFKLDSPLMKLLTGLADLMWINVLAIITSIPIFTIGASITAMETVFMRMIHKEDVMVTREYFKAFKDNFKQATIIWLILLPIIFVIGFDQIYFLTDNSEFGIFLKAASIVLGVVFLGVFLYVFPLQARYKNPVRITFKNAIILTIGHPVRSIFMILIFALFAFTAFAVGFAGYLYDTKGYVFSDFKLYPFLLLFGYSLPWFLNSILVVPVFDKVEKTEGIAPANVADEPLKPIRDDDDGEEQFEDYE